MAVRQPTQSHCSRRTTTPNRSLNRSLCSASGLAFISFSGKPDAPQSVGRLRRQTIPASASTPVPVGAPASLAKPWTHIDKTGNAPSSTTLPLPPKRSMIRAAFFRLVRHHMRRLAKIALTFATVSLLVVGWGYWHSLSHAALDIRVDDYALKSSRQSYGVPHGVTLTFRSQSGTPLAAARSVEPQGFILAVHPSADIGNCQESEKRAPSGRSSPSDYAECYERYSTWAATWASQVHDADITVGGCQLHRIPIEVRISNGEWMLWWVPLPHIGGLPRQYFELVGSIDSRSCSPQ